MPVVALAILLVLMVGCEDKEKAELEKNKALALTLLEEAYNKGNLDVIYEVCATDYTWPLGNPQVRSADEMYQHVAEVRTTFPDIHVTIEDMIAEGDKVATRWTIVGTQEGETLGIPPTGKTVTFTGILISHVVDGKLAGDWENFDALGAMQQLGVIPPMPGTIPALDRKGEDFKWGDPSGPDSNPGDPETMKEIVRREVEDIWNQGKLDLIEEFYSPNLVNHDPVWPGVRDFESFKEWIATMGPPPDLDITIEDLVCETDRVALRWTATYTDVNSGKQVTMTGIIIARFAEGKIVELWWAKDFLGALQQAGFFAPADSVKSE